MSANLDLTSPSSTLDETVAPPAACFVADTPRGPLRLYVTAHEVRHAVDAALALHRCEPLLHSLQAWSGLALDWRWDDAPTVPHGGAHVSVQTADAEIDLPWAWLRDLPPPDETTAALLPWPQVNAVLVISQLRIGLDELAQLEPAGAVVLADSLRPDWHGLLRPDWHGLLRAADEPAHPHAGVPVTLPLPDVPRLAPRAARPALHADADRRVACEVRMAMTTKIGADRLAGWHEGAPLPEAGPRATLWRHAGAQGPAQALAAGSLMPWGDGCALHIETVYR
jgi:hypothetical protein